MSDTTDDNKQQRGKGKKLPGAGRTIKSRFRARDCGRAVVGLDMLDRRQRQNKQVLEFRDQLVAECGGNPSPKEVALIEAAAFLLLRQLRFNDQMLEKGSESERQSDQALRASGTLSRVLEDLATHHQLRTAREQAERKLVIRYGWSETSPDDGDADKNVDIVQITPVKATWDAGTPGLVPTSSHEADVTAARNRAAPIAEPPPAPPLSRAEMWQRLITEEPPQTPPAPITARETPSQPPIVAASSSGGWANFNAAMGYFTGFCRAPIGGSRVLVGGRR